jgi:hypothetical protein
MGKQSHGTIHHADVTVECPSCGRRFRHPHHAGVAEDSGEFIVVQFKSKQNECWGVLRVPVELVFWAKKRDDAWAAEKSQRSRHEDALGQMAARINNSSREAGPIDCRDD